MASLQSTRKRFPRLVRLVRRSEFERVYRGGQKRSSHKFSVFYRANGKPLSRFGISVKKTLGGAVVRNRIRRRVREILRRNLLEITSGWDIVIHPRHSVEQAPFAALEKELLSLLRGTKQ